MHYRLLVRISACTDLYILSLLQYPFDSLRHPERDDIMIAMDFEQYLYDRFSEPEKIDDLNDGVSSKPGAIQVCRSSSICPYAALCDTQGLSRGFGGPSLGIYGEGNLLHRQAVVNHNGEGTGSSLWVMQVLEAKGRRLGGLAIGMPRTRTYWVPVPSNTSEIGRRLTLMGRRTRESTSPALRYVGIDQGGRAKGACPS